MITVEARACRPIILDPVRPGRTERRCLPHSPNSWNNVGKVPSTPSAIRTSERPAPGGSHTAGSAACRIAQATSHNHHRHDRLADGGPSLTAGAVGPGRGHGQLRRAWTLDRITQKGPRKSARAGPLCPAPAGRRPPAVGRHHHPAGCPLPVSATPATPPWRTLWPNAVSGHLLIRPLLAAVRAVQDRLTAGRASWRAGQTPSGAGGRDVDAGGAPRRRGPSRRR
jgi:hypothetical protein